MNSSHPKASQERILIIEDDETLALGLRLNLAAEGFHVFEARDGIQGLARATDENPDLIVLDLLLPGMPGLEVLKRLRNAGREMPVIILSARAELEDKLKGLGLGADDYVAKPFSLPELVARIHASLRRARQLRADENIRRFGDVVVDLSSRKVERDGDGIPVTSKEFDLLCYLIRRAGRVHSREQLLTAVWGFDYDGTERTVDNFIRSLRVKLEADPTQPKHIVTVRGAGYRFDA